MKYVHTHPTTLPTMAGGSKEVVEDGWHHGWPPWRLSSQFPENKRPHTHFSIVAATRTHTHEYSSSCRILTHLSHHRGDDVNNTLQPLEAAETTTHRQKGMKKKDVLGLHLEITATTAVASFIQPPKASSSNIYNSLNPQSPTANTVALIGGCNIDSRGWRRRTGIRDIRMTTGRYL